MRTQPTHTITPTSGVIALTGHGLRIHVERGYLVVSDGIADERRTARFHKSERGLNRLVILGHTGSITLDAITWLNDANIRLIQLAGNGTILAMSGALGRDDARLRRAQALATSNGTALTINRAIIATKLHGQAANLERLEQRDAASHLEALVPALEQATSLDQLRIVESDAARTYWNAWSDQPLTFARKDETRVPKHWRTFGQRISTLTGSPRKAINPANALLNYLYAILEAETILALHAVGLDPGIGLMHTDQRARASLALDLMEAARPHVDAFTLDTLNARRFRKRDFIDTRDGGCRILPPLTNELTTTAPTWANSIARHAEWLAQSLADTRQLELPTPLTGQNRRRSKNPTPGKRAAKAKGLRATCATCGAALKDAERVNCPNCYQIDKQRQYQLFQDKAAARRAERRDEGNDPTQTPAARAKRSDTQYQNAQRRAQWEAEHPNPPHPSEFEAIRQRLQGIPLSRLRKATGLSLSYCAHIRDGDAVPHAMHWDTFGSVIE